MRMADILLEGLESDAKFFLNIYNTTKEKPESRDTDIVFGCLKMVVGCCERLAKWYGVELDNPIKTAFRVLSM